MVAVNDKGKAVFRVWCDSGNVKILERDADGNPTRTEPQTVTAKPLPEDVKVGISSPSGSKGDIAFSAGSLAATTAINIQPAVGIKQQVIAASGANVNEDTTGYGDLRFLLFDGITRGLLVPSTYPLVGGGTTDAWQTLSHRGGVIITNSDYLRIYNTAAATQYYNVVLMEV